MIAVGLCVACSGDGDGRVGGSATSTTESSLGVSDSQIGGGDELDVTLTFDQRGALADGVVTEQEMAAALAATSSCLEALGHPGSAIPVNAEQGLAGGWRFEVAPSDAALAALATCRSATMAELELPFLTASAPSAEDLAHREAAIRECLLARGVDSGGRTLAEIFASVDPNLVLACDPAAG